MKRGLLFVMLALFLVTFVVAEPCDLEVSLLNQDPYPAVPGDYVDLVFQITGLENSECGDVSFELLESYPISFDPNEESQVIIKSGTYTKDYSSSKTLPYTVRVDDAALDGDNIIEVAFRDSSISSTAVLTQQFNLNVENVKAEFEIYVKDYQMATKEITFQILNTAENDIYALTLEVPKQDNIEVKGANRNIVGDLDSNDYTTTTFEATPVDGEIKLNLIYTDEINERRTVEQTVKFDSSYFEGRVADQPKSMAGTYVTVLIIVALIIWFVVVRMMKKKKARR